MLQFYMYRFEKRRNSTKSIPNITQAKVKSKVALKHPTDLINPIVILAADHGTVAHHDKDIMDSNYAWLLDRFYWVTKITSVNLNHWEIHLEVDPMATWKSYILNTNAFICYSARNGSDELIDSRLPRKTNGRMTKTSYKLPINISVQGTYIISVINKHGLVHYAINSHQQFNTLMNAIDLWWNSISEGIEEPEEIPIEDSGDPLKDIVNGIGVLIDTIGQLFVNAIEYLKKIVTQTWSVDKIGDNIKQVIWYPFEIPSQGAENIVIGSFDTGIIGKLVSPNTTLNMSYINNMEAPFPDFEAAWLRRKGYAEWAIHLPFAGTFPLSNEFMWGGRPLKVDYVLTILTGTVDIYVSHVLSDGSGLRRLITTHANLACGVMFGSSSPGIRSAVTSVLSVGSSLGRAGLSKKPTSAAVQNAAIAQAGYDVINEAINDVPYTIGGFTGSFEYPEDEYAVEIYCAYYGVSQSPPSGCAETVGVPMFRQGSLGSESGYVMCSGASVSAPATASEIDAINGYLNSGAFIE